jgi:FtsP/CotA-like multicopper oxidase with cupredoxin domain
MKSVTRYLLAFLVCSAAFMSAAAQQQQCPSRPELGTVVEDPLNLVSQNGVLSADFLLGHWVDTQGYTHYCFNYKTASGYIESPTLRLNPGDTLKLGVKNIIKDDAPAGMSMPSAGKATCGDGGQMTVSSTNVHFHGMNVSPDCHQDDVLNTLIQPGGPGFEYNIPIPAAQPPGLYWYHPHVHGFTEFQVNGGASGAIIVNGMEKVHPEVAGLTERVFLVRQQYLVPWIPGPYQLTLNYHQAVFKLPPPIVQMKPNEKQFWRVVNASLQDFLVLQFQIVSTPEQLQVIALDGYPISGTRMTDTLLVPPAGRAEFIVTAPPAGGNAQFVTNAYSTGPTGNADFAQQLAQIDLTDSPKGQSPKSQQAPANVDNVKFADLPLKPATTARKIYFSEEFGGTNGPIQFYITVDGQPQKVFQGDEKPAITTKVGAVEDWTIENHALETHAFHIHQIHFRVLEIDGKPAPNHDLRDTIEVPFWEGPGTPYHSVKVRMDFADSPPGTYVFHCHILLHEDLGMMHKILVEP